MDVVVKPITEETFDEFYNLFEKLIRSEFPEYSDKTKDFFFLDGKAWPKSRLIELLKKNERTILGAFASGKLVGVLYAEKPLGGIAWAHWLMVEPGFQRKGIGRELLQAWEEICKKDGAHGLLLNSGNKQIPFYEKVGYKNIGLFEKSWYGVDHYFMIKHLQEPKEENYLK